MKIIIEASGLGELLDLAKGLVRCTDAKAEIAAEVKAEQEKPAEEAPAAEEGAVPMDEPVAEEPAAEAAPEITLEMLRARVKEYTRSGRKDEMKAILAEFGAKKSTELKPEDYAAFMERSANA